MPHTNAQIARVFDDLAEVLEIKKELVFKVRAYRLLAGLPGLTPKTARQLLQETGATTPAELEHALTAGMPAWLPATGEGSAQALRAALRARPPVAR